MKACAILILSCASILGADTGIRVVTTVTTDESGRVSTKEVFTRDGQTNLVRNAATKDGVVLIRIHRLYRDGMLVGMLTSSPDSSSVTTEAGSRYALDFEYGRSNQLKCAAIVGNDGVLLDAFACTNGVLSPVPSSELTDAVQVGGDAKKLMSHARTVSPEQFHREVEQIIEKHNEK